MYRYGIILKKSFYLLLFFMHNSDLQVIFPFVFDVNIRKYYNYYENKQLLYEWNYMKLTILINSLI